MKTTILLSPSNGAVSDNGCSDFDFYDLETWYFD
jgi:hypothetical protein